MYEFLIIHWEYSLVYVQATTFFELVHVYLCKFVDFAYLHVNVNIRLYYIMYTWM